MNIYFAYDDKRHKLLFSTWILKWFKFHRLPWFQRWYFSNDPCFLEDPDSTNNPYFSCDSYRWSDPHFKDYPHVSDDDDFADDPDFSNDDLSHDVHVQFDK